MSLATNLFAAEKACIDYQAQLNALVAQVQVPGGFDLIIDNAVDLSVTLTNVADGTTLSAAQQNLFWSNGFDKIVLQYNNGQQTAYTIPSGQ